MSQLLKALISAGIGHSTAVSAVAGVAGEALARQNGACVGFIGHSIVANNIFSTTSAFTFNSLGAVMHLVMVSGGMVNVPAALVDGIGGSTIVDMVGSPSALLPTRLTALLAAGKTYGMQFVVVDIGTNDATIRASLGQSANDIADAIYSGWMTIAAQCLAAGVTPLIEPISPRGLWGGLGDTQTTTARRAIYQANERLFYARRVDQGYLIPCSIPNVIDSAEANGGPLGGNSTANGVAAYTYDGLHPAPRMAYWKAQSYWDVIKPLVPQVVRYGNFSLADAYNATENQWGNLLPSGGLLVGTSGTVGAGASGASGVATGATVRRTGSGSLTVECAKGTKTLPNGQTLIAQTMAIDGSAGAATSSEEAEFFMLASFPSGLIGKKVQLELFIDLTGYSGSGAPSRVSEITAQFIAQDSGYAALYTSSIGGRATQNSKNYLFADTQIADGLLRTEPFVVPAGTANFTVKLRVACDATAAAGFKASCYALRAKQVA